MSRRAAAAGLLVALVLAVSGCGGSSSHSSAATVPPDLGQPVDMTGKTEVRIDVGDNFYEPRSFAVSPNTKIVFTNTGRNEHNVTPVDAGAFTAIKSDQLQPGSSASISLPNAGEYTFYCSIHGTPQRGQRGAVVVQR